MDNYSFGGSRAAINLDEPVFLTRYKANIILPTSLQKKYGSSALLLEQHLKIDGLDNDKIPGTVSQKYRHHDRTYIGTIVDTKMQLTFDFEVNVNPETLVPYPYDLLRDWSKLLYDPATALQTLKKDHTGSASIEITNKIGQLIKYYEIPIFFPVTQLPAWNLSTNTESIYKITGFKFQCENQKDLLAG